MKKSSLIFLIPLILIFLMTFVAAQGLFDNIMGGFFRLVSPVGWDEIVIVWVIFAMLGFAFSDIINITTLFSRMVSYILGFGLAIIASLTGVTVQLAYALAGITAGLGVFSVFLSIISAFVVWILIHLGVNGISNWLLRRKAYMMAHKTGREATAGLRILKDIAKESSK